MTLTERAKQYILDNYELHTLKHMAGHLHVSTDSVRRFLRLHGLIQPVKPTGRTWATDDDEVHPDRKDFAWLYPKLSEYGL